MLVNSTNNSNNLPRREFPCVPAVIFDSLVKDCTEIDNAQKIKQPVPGGVGIPIQGMNNQYVLLNWMLTGHQDLFCN